MATKVEAFRVDTKVVHFGIPVKEHGRHLLNNDGVTPLYRVACQGRNVSYYVEAAEDQSQSVTCQRCRGKQTQ